MNNWVFFEMVRHIGETPLRYVFEVGHGCGHTRTIHLRKRYSPDERNQTLWALITGCCIECTFWEEEGPDALEA